MKKETEKLTGEKLLKTAINQILLHPETWQQSNWHSGCGTKHCIAGWCQILSGKEQSQDAMEDAKKSLGITDFEASQLFRSNCTISEMYYFAENFDRAGFNRDGFDRDGFDRAGFNRDGFNRDGFNRAGFNRAGFDRAGFDRAGFDRAGKKLTPFEI